MDPSERITSNAMIENILLESPVKSEDDESDDDEDVINKSKIKENQHDKDEETHEQTRIANNNTPEKVLQNVLSIEENGSGKTSSCKRKLFKSEGKEIKKSKKKIFSDDFQRIGYSSDDENKTSLEYTVSVRTLSETKRSELNPYVNLGKPSDIRGKRSAKDMDWNIDNMKKVKRSKVTSDSEDENCKENMPDGCCEGNVETSNTSNEHLANEDDSMKQDESGKKKSTADSKNRKPKKYKEKENTDSESLSDGEYNNESDEKHAKKKKTGKPRITKKKKSQDSDLNENSEESETDNKLAKKKKTAKLRIPKEKKSEKEDSDLSEDSEESQSDENYKKEKKTAKSIITKKKKSEDSDLNEDSEESESDEKHTKNEKTAKPRIAKKKKSQDSDLSEDNEESQSDEESGPKLKFEGPKKGQVKSKNKDGQKTKKSVKPINKKKENKSQEDDLSEGSQSDEENCPVPKSESRDSHNISTSEDSSAENSEQESKRDECKHKQKKVRDEDTNPHNNPRIIKLKKFLRLAGIRIKNYAEFWEGCNSVKAKIEKIVQHMENLGLKGPPSRSSCIKLRKKLEKKNEIAQLDVSNILDTPDKKYQGKRTRNMSSRRAEKSQPEKRVVNEACERQYARLRLLCSSSDED
ncbi:hypothetical protein M8J75_003598 [Diaphorina citri]|nr:hypothetical protein M8J75_003598 [Diaphorina citri]